MLKGPKLSQEQWKLLSSAFSNVAQAIILFSLAAFFVPEAVGLAKDFSRVIAFGFFLSGLTSLFTCNYTDKEREIKWILSEVSQL